MEEYNKNYVHPFSRISTYILIQKKAAEQYKKTKKESDSEGSTGALLEYR